MVALLPDLAWAGGILEAISGIEEVTYSLLSTKTTDASGTTTKTEAQNLSDRNTFRLNYNLLPKLNLNGGGTYEKDLSDLHQSGGVPFLHTEITRFRPYAWLTLRDPMFDVAFGYDLSDEKARTSDRRGSAETTLTRDTYSGNLNWRPSDLPSTQARFTRTSTRDGTGTILDTEQQLIYLKEEYLYRGLNAYYASTLLKTSDNIRDLEATQTTHEGKLAYTTTLLDGRVTLTTDNRYRSLQVASDTGITGLDSTLALPQPALAGLSSLDDTPADGPPLSPNPALIDGDTTISAGVNIGWPGPGGDFRRRNMGLDFGSAVAVNRLRVWVTGFTGTLPTDITNFFSWDVYTSTDNLTWSFHATVVPALFGPFDPRFEINFPVTSTRYIKVVTQPLPGGVIGSTISSLYPNIFVTEVQAFVDRASAGAGKKRVTITQTFRSHNLDIRTILFRSPSLYHRFTGDYQETGPDGQKRYNLANGLFFNRRLGPIFSTSANASFEMGRTSFESGNAPDQTRTAVLYYASLAATPLRTLTDSLVFSGNRQTEADLTSTSNSVIFYNTAQLYRGFDATLNLGALFTSNEQPDGTSLQRRDLYVNLGTGITPNPILTLSAYYLGKLSHPSGDANPRAQDTTEQRLDLGASFTPFRTLVLSATSSIASLTGQPTSVTQNYGLTWAPFPDGTLQFSLSYAENRFPENATSRIVQPTLRWYLSSRRRSFLEATYQFNTAESTGSKTESQLFGTRLNIYW